MYIVLFKTDFAAKPSLLNANTGNMHREFCIVRTKYNCVLEIQDSHTSSNCAKKTLYIYGQYIKKKIQITHAQ